MIRLGFITNHILIIFILILFQIFLILYQINSQMYIFIKKIMILKINAIIIIILCGIFNN